MHVLVADEAPQSLVILADAEQRTPLIDREGQEAFGRDAATFMRFSFSLEEVGAWADGSATEAT